MTPLAEIICNEMARSGPLPFRRFMELALYEPAHGYYASARAAIGREGDYLTSVSVGPLFGRLLAGQFCEMWERLGRPASFDVVEQGANTGDFARDVLEAARAFPEFCAALRYRIVEPFPVNAERQKARLSDMADKVSWAASVSELPPFTGVHFSNELLDAMPAHLVVRRNGEWRERYVHLAPAHDEASRFEWTDGALSAPELAAHLDAVPEVDGYETEINLAAQDWMRSVSQRLERGYVLVADYGFSRADYYHPERVRGTLVCYRRHQSSENPLARVGDQDITAHVEFTSLVEEAERNGLALAGFADQHHFIVGLAKHAFPDTDAPRTLKQQKEMRALATLMHPTMMGRGFKFLALARNSPLALRGFEFGGDPRKLLF